MDPIIWIIVAAIGLFGLGPAQTEAERTNPLGPPPWVTTHR
jgi:hypothetical protein